MVTTAEEVEQQHTGPAVDFLHATAEVPDILGADTAQPIGAVSAQEPQPAVGLSPEILEITFGTVFVLIASRAGEGAEYWRLAEQEKRTLATVWLPVLQPLWAKWVGEDDPGLMMALLMTAATIGPRLVRASAERGLQTENMGIAKSGGLPSSPGQPVPVNQPNQTGL